jgi:hypothetical protein
VPAAKLVRTADSGDNAGRSGSCREFRWDVLAGHKLADDREMAKLAGVSIERLHLLKEIGDGLIVERLIPPRFIVERFATNKRKEAEGVNRTEAFLKHGEGFVPQIGFIQ